MILSAISWRLGALAFVFLWGAGARSLLLAAAPASQPSQEQVRTWFDQLADDEADVREQAVRNLMGLSRDQLPLLKKAAEDARPLRPSQSIVLRDIVSHVFIAGEDYPVDPTSPFLGLRWPLDPGDTAGGIVVMQRVPGFGAYQMLRDGDLITGIEERPNLALLNTITFTAAIKSFQPTQTITLRLVRDGKSMAVPVQLRPRPLGLDQAGQLETWMEQRQTVADQYWEKDFRPIVGDEVS